MIDSLNFVLKLINEGKKICIDSRSAKKGQIFFALKGESFDGNNFATQAVEKGCDFAVVDSNELWQNEKFIKVDNVLSFLHKLSGKYRQQFKIPFVTITGSNGKTTTKELISCVLGKKYDVLATKGNLNNHIGAPLTILNLKNNHNMAVIEIGTNQPGEIDMLCEIVKPTHGIITNIGKAHLEGFKSLDAIITEKAALYSHVMKSNGVIFQRGENEILQKVSKNYSKVITYGSSDKNVVQGDISQNNKFLTISIKTNFKDTFGKENFEEVFETRLTGKYNFENILSAITVGLYFDVPIEKIKDAIREYIPDNSRSQIINNGNNLIFMDAYNANPTSMMQSLESFIDFGQEPKALILGDMLEMGTYSYKEHKNILNWIADRQFNIVILIGKEFFSLKEDYNEYLFFEDTDSAKDWLQEHPIKKHTVLVKGSRGIKLEKLINSL